jgi:hypothetical protein
MLPSKLIIISLIFNQNIKVKKTKSNLSAFYFLANQSVSIVNKTEVF